MPKSQSKRNRICVALIGFLGFQEPKPNKGMIPTWPLLLVFKGTGSLLRHTYLEANGKKMASANS